VTATLVRRTAEDDIADPWIPVELAKAIPSPQDVTPQEVEDAMLRAGNTSPGADSITVKLLRACWHVFARARNSPISPSKTPRLPI
jgi:hypothetical protein